MEEILSTLKMGYITTVSKMNKRIDGRGLDQYREISIKTGVAETAEGSSLVKLGDTMVMVGVKMEQTTPFPDMPDMGTLSVGAELVPLASPTFESGPPNPDAIELARVVDRAIRESKMIDLEKLCITPGEKVWGVSVDIHVLDYDGNLVDASTIGAVAALLTARVPNKRYNLGEDVKLPLKENIPVTCTFSKINGMLVIDPNLDEDRAADARISIATDQNGHIHAVQKTLGGSLSADDIKRIIKMAEIHGGIIREKILKSVGG